MRSAAHAFVLALLPGMRAPPDGSKLADDMSMRRPGPLALAVAMIGLGVLALSVRDFALFSQPVPAWLPAPTSLAVASGVLLVSAGAGLFSARTRTACAWTLTLYELVWVVARGVEALHAPAVVVGWESLCEALTRFAGVLLLAAGFSRAAGRGSGRPGSDATPRVARALFGACCIVFGVSHFAYAQLTASMVPHWLPATLALTYLTGAGHAAAGLAILAGRLDRLAATVEACMLGLFVVVLHVPSLWMTPAPEWAPTAPERWTELLIALGAAGTAGTVAESLRERPWGWSSPRKTSG